MTAPPDVAGLIAWRQLIGGKWHYYDIDPRTVHDNGCPTEPVYSAAALAALAQERDDLAATLVDYRQECSERCPAAMLDTLRERAEQAERERDEARGLLRHCLGHSREHLPQFLVPRIEAAIDAARKAQHEPRPT